MGLAQFSGRDTEDRRLQFIFRIYDMDRDGYISNGELYQVKIIEFLNRSFFLLILQLTFNSWLLLDLIICLKNGELYQVKISYLISWIFEFLL